MKVDTRILLRRMAVAEAQALSRVRRSLVVILVLGVVGSLTWFIFSHHLSIRTVVIEGAAKGDIAGVLASERVVEGRPLVSVRVNRIEEALLADPWIVSASVRLVFPSRIEVYVRERRGVAWLWSGSRWGLLADDGVLLEYADSPDPAGVLIRIATEHLDPGAEVSDEAIRGALEFAGALPTVLAEETIVELRSDELWGLVGDRVVRLGLPVQMDAKAMSLAAIIDNAPDGVLDVSAPRRPAVREPDTSIAPGDPSLP